MGMGHGTRGADTDDVARMWNFFLLFSGLLWILVYHVPILATDINVFLSKKA
jgi:hypothetical protein